MESPSEARREGRRAKQKTLDFGDETMKRTILLTAVVAIAALTSSNASAEEQSGNQSQISANLLAQLGLGGSTAVSDEEGLDIRGKGNKAARISQRRASRKSTTKLKRQKKGVYSVKYRASARSKKSTPSRSGPSRSANSFNVR